ncbi:homing endonuclease [Salmonella phage KM16]|uniref:homing endonuclease n=1 Tax=Salmonella phage KM16 TaxID=2797303 RepID=UPI00248F8F85|nr:homing endonuclease [Salmonella phage KM16]
MNYNKIYTDLISRGKTREPLSGYKENHHIIPRCVGGSDLEENLVYLTGREHFIAHWLLTKIYSEGGLKQAFGMMCLTGKNREYKVSSKLYELGKKMISEGKLGVPMKEETKRKISDTTTGVRKTEATKTRMRKPKSDEHKLNISKSKTGTLNPMYGTISPTRDIPHTDKSKLLISKQTKAKTSYPPCPWCGKKSNKGNALRWHYDNCKFKET